MCGITGFFGEIDKSYKLENLLEKMVNTLSHRGPDEKGYFLDQNVGLGISRLSIIDLKQGSQPLFNKTQAIIVVGNGEIYNHQNLRNKLAQQGHTFSCNNDMEVISHLYEEQGLEAFGRLRGMYGIALWDKKNQTGYLIRDPSGIKPLYYAERYQGVIFGSEIKSLLPYLQNIKPNLKQIKRTMVYRSSSEEDTCFEGIKKLPKSTILKYSNKKIKFIPYHPHYEDPPMKINNALSKSIGKRLMADVPLGAFLSGGLDSSLISALMKKKLGRDYEFHTFSVGFGIKGDELDQAKIVADHIGSIHHQVIVKTSDIIRDFDKIIWHMDEPTLNPAIIPSFYLSQKARQYVKVVLVGDGADEVFAGYDKHKELINSYSQNKCNPNTFFSRRMPFGFQELKNLGMNINNKFFENWSKEMLSAQSAKEYLESAMRIDREEMLPNLQLMTIDRSTMAHGLEARVPFLDVDLIRAVDTYGIGNLIQEGFGKYPLREIAKNFLPKEIYKAEKKIYFVPIHHWMNEGMSDLAQNSIFNSKIIPQLFDNNQLSKFYPSLNSYQKWSLLVLDRWFKTFF